MVREDDLERYYITLFAPSWAQPQLWALFAFNQEVAKTRENVSEPMIGEIRLQWWREALEGISNGKPREHPVVQALSGVTAFTRIRPMLDEIIDGREQDLSTEVATDFKSLAAYADKVGGALCVAAAYILDGGIPASDISAARATGRVWAMIGILRALPFQIKDDKEFSATGASLQGFRGVTIREMEQRLKPLTTAMFSFIEEGFTEATTPVSTSIRPVMALNSLSKLHMDALDKAEGSPFRMTEYEKGNLSKLLALLSYHLFKR
ncbi:phytoene/squalene synthase family protein [Kordiimonas sp.]|uniref:phytoene/squalene synthase family protein n=1 Tax=Kordiimonas sp. TaxID=1970157 RepID=UPI003A936710